MPNISEMSYGHDVSGLETYLADIKSNSLKAASEAAANTNVIRTALDETWEGNAKYDYLNNLREDVQHFQAALESLYDSFVQEVNNAAKAMHDFDEHLIK